MRGGDAWLTLTEDGEVSGSRELLCVDFSLFEAFLEGWVLLSCGRMGSYSFYIFQEILLVFKIKGNIAH